MCGEQIVVLFSKSDKPAKVLNRPGKPAAHFMDSHPKIYVKFLNNEFPKFPCDTIKVETVNVWGPQRARFKSLVASMASGAKDLRDLDCAAEYGGPNRPITVQGLERYLAKHIVANNALSYLYNLAYSNFFCV